MAMLVSAAASYCSRYSSRYIASMQWT